MSMICKDTGKRFIVSFETSEFSDYLDSFNKLENAKKFVDREEKLNFDGDEGLDGIYLEIFDRQENKSVYKSNSAYE